jgi:MarR family protein
MVDQLLLHSRLTDLAAVARMTKQSVGALVDHFEAAGYVERVQDREDARVKAIRLTSRGRHAAQAIAGIGAQIETEWGPQDRPDPPRTATPCAGPDHSLTPGLDIGGLTMRSRSPGPGHHLQLLFSHPGWLAAAAVSRTGR